MKRRIVALFVILGLSDVYGMTIAQIKKTFKDIEKNKTHFLLKKRHFEDENVGEDKTIYIDKNGAVRKLIVEGGSEDSYHRGEYFYTKNGNLFFSYLKDANVGGCSIEIRNYISEGKIIKQLKKISKCSLSHAYPLKIFKPKSYFNHE